MQIDADSAWRARLASFFAALKWPIASRERAALTGIVLVFVTVGLVEAVSVPGFAPLDEPRHLAYAVALTHGKLPTVFDKLPFDRLGREPVHGSHLVTAANHPPLYYVLVACALELAGGEAELARGLFFARILTLLLATVGLVYAYRALRHVTPERPEIALAAVAGVASTPAFVNCSAVIMNDALAFLAAAGLFDAALSILLRGPSRRASIGLAVFATMSALTRFAGLLLLPVAFVAVFAGYWLHDEGAPIRRLLRAAVPCAAALACAAAFSGYFYRRNLVLYDDVTGARALLTELHRAPRASFIHQATSGERWLDLLDGLFDKLAGGVDVKGLDAPGRALFALGAFGLGRAAFRARKRLARAPHRDAQILACAAMLLAFAAVALPIFEFYARGGGLSARYAFPALWVVWFFVALGLATFDGAVVPAAATGAAVWSFVAAELYLTHFFGARGGGEIAMLRALEKSS
ncbi:MAG TPA: hypothetical protein VHB21_24815, partial [Minicystis sp.]|nr:hypothetical protein [Minicystis sp.]